MAKEPEGRRVRRNVQQWLALVAEQAGSGVSQRVFCASRGVSLSSFNNARRRLARSSSASDAEADFVTVPLEVSRGGGWDLELSLGEGMVLRVRRG